MLVITFTVILAINCFGFALVGAWTGLHAAQNVAGVLFGASIFTVFAWGISTGFDMPPAKTRLPRAQRKQFKQAQADMQLQTAIRKLEKENLDG